MPNFENIFHEQSKKFLVVYQLWRKFNLEFYYLDAATIKYAILIELNKAQKMMDNLEKLVELNARIF